MWSGRLFCFSLGRYFTRQKKAITSGAGAAVRIHTYIYILSFGERHIIWSIGPIPITGGRGPPAESNQTPRAIVPITKWEKCATAQVLNYLSLLSLSLLISNEIGSALRLSIIHYSTGIKCIDTWAHAPRRGETFICVRQKNLVCRAKR